MLILSLINGISDTTTANNSESVLITVLSAGLSIAVAQSIILFINRVKPGRFILSLMIQALIFTAGYFLLSFSTWFVGQKFFETTVTYATVANIVGLSYAPLKWAFLAAMPYLGEPIFFGLSLWGFLIILTNFAKETGLNIWQSFSCVIWGWFVLRLIQQTIGHPLAIIGERLLNGVAGVKLVRDSEELSKIVASRRLTVPTSTPSSSQLENSKTGDKITETNVTPEQPISPNESPQVEETVSTDVQTVPVKKESSWFDLSKNQSLGLIGVILATILTAIGLAKLAAIVAIGFILIVGTAVLSPLESLGWWAGWYGDKVDTAINVGEVLEKVPTPGSATRYVLYLDGIGQSTYNYDVLVDTLLEKLAAIMPDDMVLISGFMPYSILNIPLTGNRIFQSFWRWVEGEKEANSGSKWTFAVYIRNMFTVAISVDRRYGPIYNQGMAQLIYNSLLKYGYQPNSRVPITLVGYSGGGQVSMGALPYLKESLHAPIEIISLAGVLSGNTKAISLEHLYHLAGERDGIEQLAPTLFPKRRPIFFLSYWNRAKRRGQISMISLGPVAHNGPEGVLDPDYYLPDGRSSLQQTLDWISGIILGKLRVDIDPIRAKSSDYERYRQAEFEQARVYPFNQSVSPELYRPIAPWMGRLILPGLEQRQPKKGILFEVYHADKLHEHLLGKTVHLAWSDSPQVKDYLRDVTRDLHFSDNAEYSSRVEGFIEPTRLNHWRQVDPLESLAGARPYDDMVVMLREPVAVSESEEATIIKIDREPVQISGRYYGLVSILHPIPEGDDKFKVVHFNRESGKFDGAEEIIELPQVVADSNDTLPATNKDIENSPLNKMGWYVYGAKDSSGVFVVKALAPRELFRLQPQSIISDREAHAQRAYRQAALKYIKSETWDNLPAKKGKIQSVLLCPQSKNEHEAVEEWQEGDRALLLHVYGGIGGRKKEPAAESPIYFGHFAYGNARVIREPLSDELRFEIEYHQVYTHNVRGLISGNMHWSAYMGDRQWGFLGTRPVCDLLVKLDDFTADFDFDGKKRSALSGTISELEAMNARYRIGDGTGATYVGPANNCAQDSNQALYASLRNMEKIFQNNSDYLKQWGTQNPEQGKRFLELLQLKKDLKSKLMPFGTARADWEEGSYDLGSCLEDRPVRNLFMGLASWRTLLPRLASDTVAQIFLEQGASVWVLRTNQVGGNDPDIEPLAPMTI